MIEFDSQIETSDQSLKHQVLTRGQQIFKSGLASLTHPLFKLWFKPHLVG